MKILLYISLFVSFSSFGQSFRGGFEKKENLLVGPPTAKGGVGNLFEELPADLYIEPSVKFHSSLKPAIRVIPKGHETQTDYNEIIALSDLNYLNSTVSNYKSGQYKAGLGAQFESYQKGKWFLRLAAVQGVSETDSSILFLLEIRKYYKLYGYQK